MAGLGKALYDSPRLLLSLCALFWAGNFVLGRAMHEAILPIELAFWRWAGATALVLPFAWPTLRRQWPLLKAHRWRMLLLALLGVSGFNTLVYIGLQETTATNAVLIQSTVPVQILLLNALLFAAPMRLREVTAVLVSLLGVALILSTGDLVGLATGGWNPGDLWLLTAALVWASYSVLLRWRPAELDARAFLGFTLLVGWLALLPLYIAESALVPSSSWTGEVLATVAYVAIFPSALAYLFWNRGVALLGANTVGQFAHLMPVFGVLLAMVFLNERPGWYHVLGILLVATGLWLAARRPPI